jgi:hypothetical protein
LDGEGVILVGDQQDGGKKRQISTPVNAFSAIVGVSLNSPDTFTIDNCKCVRGIPKYTCYLEIIKWTKILGQENKQDF